MATSPPPYRVVITTMKPEPDQSLASVASESGSDSNEVIVVMFGDRPIEVRLDIDDLGKTLRSIYASGGSIAVWQFGEELTKSVAPLRRSPRARSNTLLPARPSRDRFINMSPLEDAGKFADLFAEARTRLWDDIREGLQQVEATAHDLLIQRLELSRARIRIEARRYLDGLDLTKTFVNPGFAPRPRTLRLKAGADLDSLRATLAAVAALEARAEAVVEEMNQISIKLPIAGTPPEYERWRRRMEEAPQEHEEILQRRALRIADAGRRSPILFRLAPQATVLVTLMDGDDSILLGAIEHILWNAWDAIAQVEKRAQSKPAAALGVGVADAPARRLADRLSGERGPWAYPLILQAALDENGYDTSSITHTAVSEALLAAEPGLAGSLAEAGAVMAALMTLHLAAPPVGLAADCVVGAYEAFVELSRFEQQNDDYLAFLDPAEALARPPSFLPVVAAIIGALPFVPGSIQFGVGVLPALLPDPE